MSDRSPISLASLTSSGFEVESVMRPFYTTAILLQGQIADKHTLGPAGKPLPRRHNHIRDKDER
jgi:hypothetical protein